MAVKKRSAIGLSVLMALLASACASKQPMQPKVAEVANKSVVAAKQVRVGVEAVPHEADIAAYDTPPEHVINAQNRVDYVVVNVQNYKKPAPKPTPIYVPFSKIDPSVFAKAQEPKVQIDAATVNYPSASHKLTATAKEVLDKLISSLSSTDVITVTSIVGHADSVGGDEYNKNLSSKRARAVADYLIAQGVPESSISLSGLGESVPIESNSSARGRAKNRRTDIEITHKVKTK